MSDAEFTVIRRGERYGQHRLEVHLCSDGGSDLNRFFEALADDRRRRILIYLQQNERTYLQDIAKFLADQEEIELHSGEFRRIQIDLIHLHLPKLADHGLLSFNNQTNSVSQEPLPIAVEQILSLAADLDETDGSHRSTE